MNLSATKQILLNTKVFAETKKLRLLKIYWKDRRDSGQKDDYKLILPRNFEFPSYRLSYLHWEDYPLESMPSGFYGENLIELNLKNSNIKQLWQGNQV